MSRLSPELDPSRSTFEPGIKPAVHTSFEEKDPDLCYLITGHYQRLLQPVIPTGQPAWGMNIGCGGSLWLERALKGNYPQLSLVSVDIDQKTLTQAKPHSPGKHMMLADAGTLPFQDETFHAVLLNGSVGEIGRDRDEVLLS